MKVESYKAHILYNVASRTFLGELWVNGIREVKTHPLMNELVAINALNKRIDSFNFLNNTKIPPYEKGKENMKKSKSLSVEPNQTKVAETIQAAPPEKPKRKPHRKSFTPYGLTGYLVDKQGNIRLHLDRRASARTIVLEPAMFAMLAEMVKATQEQTK